MADKDPDLEKLDLDDELDIPEFDDSMLDPGGNSKRQPIEKIKGGFYEGLKNSALSRSNQKDMISKALPKGYGKAFNDSLSAVSLGQDLYDTARENLVPVHRDLKKIGRYVAGKTKDFLPAALQAYLEKLVEPEDDTSDRLAKIDENKAEITSAVSEVFGEFLSDQTKAQRQEQNSRLKGDVRGRNLLGAQLDLALKRAKQDSSDRLKDDVVTEARWRTESNLLNMMRSGIERLVDYQDRVTASYQRKSLELQYRQFFVARDNYALNQAYVKQTNEQLNAVVKNTAMPEFLKTQTNEAARSMMRERMLGKAGGLLNKKTQGVRERLMSAVNGLTANLRDGIQTASSSMDMVSDMPVDGHELGGSIAGDVVGGGLLSAGARKFGKMIGRNDTIARWGDSAEYLSDNKSEIARDKLNKMREYSDREGLAGIGDSIKSAFAEVAVGFLPNKSAEMSFGRDATGLAGEASPYTSLADKSITEIIPGLLTEILHEAEMLRTSDPTVQRRVYDFESGEIRQQSEVQRKLVKRALPEGRMDSIRDDLTTIVDRLDPDGHLSAEARLGLTRQLLSDASRGRRFDPLRLFSRGGLHEVEDEGIVGEIQHLIKERFLRADGEFRKYDRTAVKLTNESSRTFNRAKEDIPNYQETIAHLMPLYGARLLREAGLVAEDQAPGETRADTDSILDYINTGNKPGQGGTTDELSEVRRRFGPTPIDSPGASDRDRDGGDAGVDHRGFDRVVGVLERLVEVQRSTDLREQFEHVLNAIAKINPLEHLELNGQWLKDIYGLLRDSLGGGPGGGGGPGSRKGPKGPKGPSRFNQAKDRMQGMTGRQKERWGDVLGSAKGRLSQMDAGRARRELKQMPAMMEQMFGGMQAQASAVGEDAISYGRSIGTGMGEVGDRMRSSMNDRNYGGKMADIKRYLEGQLPDDESRQQLSDLLSRGKNKGRQARAGMATKAQQLSMLGSNTTDSVLGKLKAQGGRLKGRGREALGEGQEGLTQLMSYLQDHGVEFADTTLASINGHKSKLKGKGGQLRSKGQQAFGDGQAGVAQALAYLQQHGGALADGTLSSFEAQTGKLRGKGAQLGARGKSAFGDTQAGVAQALAYLQEHGGDFAGLAGDSLNRQKGKFKGKGSQLLGRGKAGLDDTQAGIVQALAYLQEHGGEFADLAGSEFGKQTGKLKGKGSQLRSRGKAGLEDTQANIAQAISYLQENAPELDMSARLLDLGETGKGLGGRLSRKAKDSARLSREAMDKVVTQVQRRMASSGGNGGDDGAGGNGGSGGGEGGDGYWARAQGLLDQLMTHLDRKTEQLQESIENLTLAQMAADAGEPGMLKRLSRGAASGLGGIMSFYGGIWSSVGNLAKGGTGMLGNLAGKMFSGRKAQGDEIMDIYVKGHKRPAMLARDLRAGRYFDQETGDIIQRIDEITGPVIDENDNVVISQYDLDEGLLVNREGKSVMDRIKSVGGGLTSFMTSPYRAAFAVGGTMLKTAKSWLNRPRDIYVKGEDKPRLLAVIMKNGGYVSDATGKVIKGIKDIDGAVKDRQGNVVLSHEDIQQGLIDSRGKAIRGILSGAKKIVGGALSGVAGYVSGTYGAMGRGAKGLFNKVTGRGGAKDAEGGEGFSALGSSSKQQASLLKEIRDILDERMKKPLRKGGWRSQLMEENQLALSGSDAAKAKSKKKDKAGGGGGFMDMLKKMLGFGGGGLGAGMGLDVAGDLLTAGRDTPDRPDRSNRPKGKLSRLWGGVKKWGGKALGGAARLAPLALPAIGTAVSAGGSLLAGLGTAIAGVVSAPVVLAVGAAAAVGAAGYFAYRHFSRKPDGPLHRVRLAQYGANPDNKDHVGQISLVEDAMEDEVQFEGNRLASLGKGVDLEEVMEDFGVDLEDQVAVSRWLMWFQERFKPVYLSHAVIAKDILGSADLSETDDMDKKLKRSYLRRTQFKGDQMPYGAISPFKDVEHLPGVEKVNEELTKALKTLPPPSESDRIDAAAEAKLDRRNGNRPTTEAAATSMKAAQAAVSPRNDPYGRPVRTATNPLSSSSKTTPAGSLSSMRGTAIAVSNANPMGRMAAEGEANARSRQIDGNDEAAERAVSQKARQERIARQTAVQSTNISTKMAGEMQRMVGILSESHKTQQSMDASLKDINTYFQDIRKQQDEKERRETKSESGGFGTTLGPEVNGRIPPAIVGMK